MSDPAEIHDSAPTNAPSPDGEHVGIREVRHAFRSYLERVQRGEHFVITDRGHPIGQLVPLNPSISKLQQMIADGRIIPAKRPFTPPVFDSSEPFSTAVSDELQRMRDEERDL